MKKIDLLYGILIGFLGAFLGCFLFISLFTDFDFMDGVHAMKSEGKLGKLITIGAILNLFIFFFLLKQKREMLARGVVFGTIILTFITLFV